MLSFRRAVSAKRDYYEVLGVSRDAQGGEIKRAYRKCAMKFHPDRNPGDAEAEERFKEAAEAFEVLNDGEKRELYDRFGHEGPSQAGFSGFSGTEEVFSHFGDVFGDLFGGLGFGSRRGGARRGGDMKVVLPIGLGDAFEGGEHDVTVAKPESCGSCDGSGAAAGTSVQTCPQCNGQGQVIHRQGFFQLQTTCPGCRGQGKVITKPCGDCSGTGTVERESTLTLNVPAGIDDGQTLRIQGRGLEGAGGGPPGNLYVIVQVKEDPRFVRDEADIHTTVRVSMFQAALGCDVQTDTLEGKVDVEIEPGTQPGTTITLRGKGMPILGRGRGRGEHIVHVEVRIPEDLSSEHEAVLREVAEARDESISVTKSGFFGFGRKKRKRG